MRKLVPAVAVIAVCLLPLSVVAADTAKDFVQDAIKGDNSEIMLGQLAEQHAGSQGVRAFGQTLATDHSKAKAQMVDLAMTMNIKPVAEPTPEAMEMADKLGKLNGATFDKEFVKGMVEDHEKDIAKFEKEANANTPASQLAAAQLPTLRKHLEMAKELEAKL